jgi:hypothetical protein
MKCPCGEVFAMYEPAEVVLHIPHISAVQAAKALAATMAIAAPSR